jgi:hypothetical protein
MTRTMTRRVRNWLIRGNSILSLGQTCSIEEFDLVDGEYYVLCVEKLGDGGNGDGMVDFVLDFLADGEVETIEI